MWPGERGDGENRWTTLFPLCPTDPWASPLQFLLIFRKAAAGELQEDSGLHVLARLSEIDVSTEGVKGAKNFFEAKVRSQGLRDPAVWLAEAWYSPSCPWVEIAGERCC